MDINKILNQLDDLFAARQFDKVEDFLKKNYEQAVSEGDTASKITLLNEFMGFYRESTQFNKALECAKKVLHIMKEMGLEGTMDYATTLLNVANAYRAAGLYEQSMECYNQVLDIYDGRLDQKDFMYATLYNNISILYQAMGNYTKAAVSLYHALDIVKLYEGAEIEQAVTYTNLGATLVKDGKIEEALFHLKKAEEIFNRDAQKDYHYSACMDALGEVYYMQGEFGKAAECYETALKEIEATVGRNQTYYAVKESLSKVYEKLGKRYEETKEEIKEKTKEEKTGNCGKVLDLCKEYYVTYGAPMIREKFPEYEKQIAVGLVGEGSECFGFDDDLSKDHDCGPGFCMWMKKEIYEKIGDRLNEEYEKLPDTFQGIKRYQTEKGSWRTGAMPIGKFYQNILGVTVSPVSETEWGCIEEWRLATATNGKVFVDEEGIFTKLRRELLKYYPDRLWIQKIINQLAKCAQSGQYNYGRMMARGEYVTAKLALANYMEDIMQLVYLLNRKYAPYYKWTHRGMKNVRHLPEIYDILRAMADMEDQRGAWEEYSYDGSVNEKDNIAMTIEIIAKLVVNKLNELGLSEEKDGFLQNQAQWMAEHMDVILRNVEDIKSHIMEERREALIEKIVILEWQAFDQVQNQGGRADCQDDWTTFSIMRKSQYMTWTEEMLESFLHDFESANVCGRNLITEKYGRMMESTAPEEYEKIKEAFPKHSEERMKIQEQIIEIQVGWMEEFAKNYRYMAENARSIHTSEDNLYNTSYETYLRGELGTYSEKTLILYANFIVGLAKEGKNLAKMTMENTAILYGFDSLEEAERYCKE